MKNISYLINGVLAVAVIILFILFFTSKKGGADSPELTFHGGDSSAVLPVAYVNLDSLLLNYNFHKDENDKLMRKIENSNATMNQKKRQVDAEAADFQKKIDNNAFLSQERAQQEYARIQKLAADLQTLAQRMDNEIALEQQRVSQQTADSVKVCVKEFNKKANYQIIFSNSGVNNILWAKESYDVTPQLIKLMNSRYTPEKK